MSDMLKDLVGHKCSIMGEDGEYFTGSPDIVCEVLASDGEWIKAAYTDKTGRHVVRLGRTDVIESVLVYGD